MKPNLKSYIFLFTIMMMTASCNHYYYAPNANNVPVFKEKNEARLQAQASTGNYYSGFDVQGAYALTNHVGLQLNLFHGSEDDDENGSGKGTYMEAAAGYFKPVIKNHCVFETYAGVGFGNLSNIFKAVDVKTEEAKTSVTKFFVQPSFGYSSNHFAIAVSSKFSLVNFGLNQSTVTKENNPYDYPYLQSMRNGKSLLYWEPGLMLRGGFRECQAFAQLTVTHGNETKMPIDNTNFSLGIIFSLKFESTQHNTK